MIFSQAKPPLTAILAGMSIRIGNERTGLMVKQAIQPQSLSVDAQETP